MAKRSLTSPGRLERSAGEPDPANPLAPFVLAFHYDLLEGRNPRRENYGPYAPVVETDNHAWPPRLETLAPRPVRHGPRSSCSAPSRQHALVCTICSGSSATATR